jgi:hypothetical protein
MTCNWLLIRLICYASDLCWDYCSGTLRVCVKPCHLLTLIHSVIYRKSWLTAKNGHMLLMCLFLSSWKRGISVQQHWRHFGTDSCGEGTKWTKHRVIWQQRTQNKYFKNRAAKLWFLFIWTNHQSLLRGTRARHVYPITFLVLWFQDNFSVNF